MRALDLFAGPGGWDLGAAEFGVEPLGIEPLGIEWDEAACATRKAAGLPTSMADVAALDPAEFAPVELLIASPPCQAWSMAGKRDGVLDQREVFALARRWAEDPTSPAGDADWHDPRSKLAAEPMRWAATLRPRLMA